MTNTIQPLVLFSGGRTSGYMLRMLLDSEPNFIETHKVVFCNTGKEMPQTLDFVHRVEKEWGVPITWLEYNREKAAKIPAGVYPTKRRNQNLQRAVEANETAHWFRVVDYDTASRDGLPFSILLKWMTVLPKVVSRGCSTQLKIRTAMRYMFSLGYKEYASIIGIRKDEFNRAIQIKASCDSFEHPQFPLIDRGKTEKDVLGFWAQNSFDLQLRSFEGNCDFCFLKAKWKRVLMARRNPKELEWWLKKEKEKPDVKNGQMFRLGEPYAMIQQLANTPNDKLPKRLREQLETAEADKRVRETDPEDFDIPCSCAEKGFGGISQETENLMDDPLF